VSTFVEPHVGRAIVLKMDLRDFFATITAARVVAIFLTAGYPEPVARLMAGLCTNTVPRAILDRAAGPVAEREPSRAAAIWQAGRLYGQPHLPQGAPTSPALANLAAYRLDARLSGLAGAAGAHYTRYADDLVFSGGEDFARSIDRFPTHVAATAVEEGFAVQHRKTRVMRRGRRQCAAGVVINDKINMARDDHDRLKAILCNCVRHGPRGQNREGVPDFRAHLAGRVAHAARLNPERGARLTRLFERIVW
jgi:RNA-directed DNA polymerase